WGSIGFLVTVFVAGTWFEAQGMGQFPTLTVLSLVAVVISAFALPDLKEAVTVEQSRPAVGQVLRQRSVQWFFVSAFFHVLAHIGIYVFFSLYLDALGYSKTLIGLLWAVSVLVEIAWFIWQSRWLHWLPMSGWLVLCSGAMVLRMLMTSVWADVLWVLVLAQCLHALTFATHHTASVALLSHHFPGRLRGRGQALYTVIAYGLTGVLGGVVGGFMSERWGLVSVFQASVVTALLAVLSGWQVWRHHHPLTASQA
ncbi:MAG: putative 3-phenylpropionic acid transporter, partial [Pseudomonadota bacterium]